MEVKLLELGCYKLEIKKNCFGIYDNNGKVIYWEDNDGNWYKYTYNETGKLLYREDVKGIVFGS